MGRRRDNARTVQVPGVTRKLVASGSRAHGRGVRAASLIAATILALACPKPPPPPQGPPPPPPQAEPPREIFDVPAACTRVLAIEVRKHERRLVADCAGGVRIALAIGLSREPVGAKQLRGDQRIPEGDYRIAGPARASRFHRFVPIDYPSLADAERALAAGVITPAERRAIAAAHARGALPPQETALGGHIGLHGEGRRWRGELGLDWTEGCIALADADIELLAERAPVGTPLRIVP